MYEAEEIRYLRMPWAWSSWDVNRGGMPVANLAADLGAWVRLLGLHDVGDLADAGIDTMRFRLYHAPGRLTKHARRRLRIAATLALGGRVRHLPAATL